MNWHDIFSFDVPVLEIFIRGTVMYLSLIVLMRIILKRQEGAMQTGDLLLVILLADASQNGMAGEYKTVSDGLVLVATLMFWNFILDYLTFRFRWMERMMQAKPLLLIHEGKIMHRNMRKEFITQAELMAQLREQGLETVEEVKKAFIESDGKISIIPLEDVSHNASSPKEKTP
jgi:uncharacterized membrane protein YcaP (DUF421 family)